ncbi:LOW QUALITY PROTEIN: asialoglycoprotein receptor 1 [Betta splendens]|uniref:LOW QUALITY PROTEIN: asialoglycoprotein receptor 1 n=1 Tax=Betta splendens TaxID=158456 RepID=A0A6P7LY42_BETSP|nr:LOW QUALITY PROTEIN: asialoglycoprotein receptor 1 [Betta splendens]
MEPLSDPVTAARVQSAFGATTSAQCLDRQCLSVEGLGEKRSTRKMTTEYHDEPEDDSSSFWNKEPTFAAFSGVSRFRRWLIPALTASLVLVLVIALGASNASLSRRLWSVETIVSNLSDSLSSSQQLIQDAAKDVTRLKFSVETNREQLSSVSAALKQLSVLDTVSRTVATLKCSLERLMKNASAPDGCCPLGWELSGSSCYLYSKTALTWPEARDWCNGHESHLVILHSDEEWDFVTRHANGVFFWIGLSDDRIGKWEWVNQTPYVMNRRRWRPNQPDSWTGHGMGPGDEDCAHLHNDGRLNDLHCSPGCASSARDTSRAAEQNRTQLVHKQLELLPPTFSVTSEE